MAFFLYIVYELRVGLSAATASEADPAIAGKIKTAQVYSHQLVHLSCSVFVPHARRSRWGGEGWEVEWWAVMAGEVGVCAARAPTVKIIVNPMTESIVRTVPKSSALGVKPWSSVIETGRQSFASPYLKRYAQSVSDPTPPLAIP